MKRLALLILLAATGCSSYEICTSGGKTMCYIENSNWALFNVFPIASGDYLHPNENASVWFTDTVELKNNIYILDRAMTTHKYRNVKDLCSYKSDEVVIPLLFIRHIYHTSAELTK